MRWKIGGAALVLGIAMIVGLVVRSMRGGHYVEHAANIDPSVRGGWTKANVMRDEFSLQPGGIVVGWKTLPKNVNGFTAFVRVESKLPVSIAFLPLQLAEDAQLSPQLLDDPVVRNLYVPKCPYLHVKKVVLRCDLDIRTKNFVMYVRDDRSPTEHKAAVMPQESSGDDSNQVHVSYWYKER